jgi:Protein of unknown function (DUF3307)
VPWVEIFAVFVVCHLVGDFLLQTEWQAQHKHGGLRYREHTGALVAHTLSYTAAFVPALIWLADSLGAGVFWLALLIAAPHMIQDDAYLVDRFMLTVKHSDPAEHEALRIVVDQVFHIVALFLTALVAAS